MKKYLRKILALTLVGALALTGTACGSGEGQAGSQDASSQAGESSASEGADGEAVTLKMFIRNQSKYTGLQEDPVAKYVEEKLGVRIELTVDSSLGTTSGQASSFNELLAAKLASNDLDDIMDFGTTNGDPEVATNLKRAAESGLIIPLDDLVKETEHLNSDPRLVIRNEYRRDYLYGDGKFYSLGGWGGMGLDQLPAMIPWIRWDLYKDLGYPDITNDDELLNVLKQMQELSPQTPNGETIYAFGDQWADQQGTGDVTFYHDYPLSKGYEALEGNYAAFFNHATREVENLLVDPDSVFWDGIEFYFKANQMGLIDPGSSVMSGAEYTEKLNNGNYLASLNGWNMTNKEGILENKGISDSGYMPIKPMEDVQAFTLYWESVLGGNEFVITKNCKYPEKAIQFLDWCMTDEGSRIITQGLEGEAWEYVDGVPALTEKYREDQAAGVDVAEVYGRWKYGGINAFQHIDRDADGNYIQPEQQAAPETYSTVKKDALAFYGGESFNEYWTTYKNRAGEEVPNVVWQSYSAAIGDKPDDIKLKYAQINDYMYRTCVSMVLAGSQEEFEAMKTDAIAEVKNLGAEDVSNWYKDRMAEIRVDLDPMIEDVLPAYGMD